MEQAVVTQTATIEELENKATLTDEVLSNLAATQELRAQQDKALSTRLWRLEKDNELVKKFMDLSVPPDVSRVLNDARTRGKEANSAPKSATSEVR